MNSIAIDTKLGKVHFSVHAEPVSGSDYEVQFKVVELDPNLPPGMSVLRARAVVVMARSHTGFERFEYSCRLVTDIEGSPNPGEHLDAQEWEGEDFMIVIGTEDGEALSSRIPSLEFPGDPLALVKCQKDGIRVPLKRIPAKATIGLHFIIAENTNPEPVECSAWFAVGLPHRKLMVLVNSSSK